jgi:hypothetical protein
VETNLKDLAQLLSGMFGSAREFAEHKSEVLRLVESIYGTIKETSIQDVDLPFMLRSGGHIGITTDGTRVEGVVDVSPKAITVTILSPFTGRKANAEIKMIVPAIWTVKPEDGSKANEEGRRKAAALLCDLYYSFLERN